MALCGYGYSPAFNPLVVGYGTCMDPCYAYGDYDDKPPLYEDHMKPSCSKNAFKPIEKRKELRQNVYHSNKPRECPSNSGSNNITRKQSRTSETSTISQSIYSPRVKQKKNSLLDTFRGVLHSTSSKSKTKSPKELEYEERISEVLKGDGFGSKKWLFYPRNYSNPGPLKIKDFDEEDETNTDKRIKIDKGLFTKSKSKKKFYNKSPFTKLKMWELTIYKKLGFVHAV